MEIESTLSAADVPNPTQPTNEPARQIREHLSRGVCPH